MSRSTPEARTEAKRALLLWFAMFGREGRVQEGADLFADVVRRQADSDGDGSDLIAANAAIRETSRLLEAEDERYRRLLAATEDDLLDVAKENMIDFDPIQPVASLSTAVLSTIDATIHSLDDPQKYFSFFRDMPLFKQTRVLEKLISASGDHSDIHGFTDTLFNLLRGSLAYEPSVHGKLQREFLRVRKPKRPQGRPANVGNEMLAQLIEKTVTDFKLPKSTAAKIVQEVVPTVLDVVRGPDGKVVRSMFAPTDAAIKKILSKQ